MIHASGLDNSIWLQLKHKLVKLPWPLVAASPEDAIEDHLVVFSAEQTALCSAVGSRYYAVATDAKVVKVFAIDQRKGPPCCEILFTKRPAFLLFADDGDNEVALLVADKGGDVARVDLPSGRCQPILGHLAMLTSIASLQHRHQRYLATGDADARIRISRLPNAYNIESFCLGHSAPVLGLSACLDECLVSLSSDGTLRTWRAIDGAELSMVQVGELCGPHRVPCHLVVSQRHRILACIAVDVGLPGDGDKAEASSTLLQCRIGPAPDCVLGNAEEVAASSELLACGKVAACCLLRGDTNDFLLLLGNNPQAPIEARRFLLPDGGGHHLAATLPMATRRDAAEAADLRLDFFRDVLNYARLEGAGLQEYLDGKAERIERLKLKRKRKAPRADDVVDDAAADAGDQEQLEADS